MEDDDSKDGGPAPSDRDDIFKVVAKGRIEDLERLLALGARVDARDEHRRTPLHVAVGWGRLDAVRLLLAHDAPVDDVDENDCSPLLCYGGIFGPKTNIEIARLLIDRGADIHRRSKSSDGLIYSAVVRNDVDLISLLVKSGASIEQRYEYGNTLLHIAARHGRAAAVSCLLALGADTTAKNNEGRTPREVAQGRATRPLLPAVPPTGARAFEAYVVMAKLTELGWFKYVPPSEVDVVRDWFRDAYAASPTILAPEEEIQTPAGTIHRGSDRRSCVADSEELSEGGITEVFMTLQESFAHEGVRFREVRNDVTNTVYSLVIDGTRHVLFDYDVAKRRFGWDDALDATVTLANQLLEKAGSSERLYSLGEGNDSWVILLSPALVKYVKTLPITPRLNRPVWIRRIPNLFGLRRDDD